ncbi:DegQ family serine endoprotease [Fontimonas sp. SYSU GA230001]|uniref:DegQ family serine endoprotease n=1 Tax=Fontimonas sp. SYSU GA230001 TaxID=3142450 RepID=UPI0032B434A6
MPSVVRLLPCLAVAFLPLLSSCGRSAPPSSASYPDFADLVEQVSPAVVNISTVPAETPPAEGAEPSVPDGLDEAPEWFRKFFEQQQEDEPADGDEFFPDQQSLGSGFILWDDGYILTNYHVIRGAREVIVRLLDRRQFNAQLVGSDEASDLALLRIDAKDLPVVKIGQSLKLRPGQWVLAIGSPFGFDYSVTAGIVSAKGRALVTEQYVPFIQTDVAINPGNSGGPLFNLAGEVVGVNSQIYSQSGGYMGVSFAIPIDIAAKVARQLRDTGVVTRGWLGVVVQEVDRDLARQFGMAKAEGALIARVLADSPAARAGLREGDVILRYNGEPLPSSRGLPHMVGITDPGEIATLDVMRDGKEIRFKVEVGTLRAEQPTATPAQPPARRLGMRVRALSADERRAAQIVGGGVLVTEVGEGPAARAGVRSGDILIQLAGQVVDSPARFDEVAARLTPGQTIAVLVQRGGAPMFLALDVPPVAEK